MINALIGSLFVYKMNVLPSVSKAQYDEIHRIIRKYIWCNKKSKIPPYENLRTIYLSVK